MKGESKVRILCQNRKARHDYAVSETIEAGIVLTGPEVKSLRNGGGNLRDSYAVIRGGEVYVNNMHISPYDKASIHNMDPTRSRKLLMHKREIERLSSKVKEKGLTLIPLSVYLKGSLIKLELGLAKGRKSYDKKQAIKERDVLREMEREVRKR